MDSLILESNYYDPQNINDIFLKRVYNYYYMKGYIPIIVDKITYILINLFLIIFINFLTNCVNYGKISQIDKNIITNNWFKLLNYGLNRNNIDNNIDNNISFGNVSFSNNSDNSNNNVPNHHTIQNHIYIRDYIDFSNLFPTNKYLLICLTIYFIYMFCMILRSINEIKLVLEMKTIFTEKFKISNSELEYISWNKVVDKIKLKYNNPNLNNYTISNRILRKENLIIHLYKNNLNYLPNISKLLEWNFSFCIIQPLFNNRGEILNTNKQNLKRRIKDRCILVGIINILSLPFVLYIVIIYMLIRDGEEIYNNPELSFNKQLNIKGFWKLRYYNELNHEYDRRAYKIKEVCDKINTYHNANNKTIEIILRFVNFVLSSIFILLVILSLINDTLLTNGIIIGDKTTLWVIGILGAILTISHNFINLSYNKRNDYHNEEALLFTKMQKYVPIINPVFYEFKNRKNLLKIMNSMFCSKMMFLYMEIVNICLSPYYLYKWFQHSHKYIDILIDNLENHYITGNILDKSNITNLNYLTTEPHCYFSYLNFLENNPKWQNNILDENKNNDDTNSFIWNNNIVNIEESIKNMDLSII